MNYKAHIITKLYPNFPRIIITFALKQFTLNRNNMVLQEQIRPL